MQFVGRQNMAGVNAAMAMVGFGFQLRKKCDTMSRGTGKMMVEFFSAEIVFNV